jgi:hypothetical protein
VPRIFVPILRFNYAIVTPWIVLSTPRSALGQESILVMAVVALVGSAGMFLRNKSAVFLASASLLLLIIWGKAAGDIYGQTGPDSALLLFEFMMVIFFMEASSTALTYDSTIRQLRGRNDEISDLAKSRVTRWVRVQIFNLGKLTIAAFGLSLGLLILGSLVSVSVNHIAFTGVLVLAALLAIFILLTYRREPEEPRKKSLD